MSTMRVLIMRGLPGSGKSTWLAQQGAPVVYSADTFHMVDGVYRFNLANIAKAHDRCLRNYLLHLQTDLSSTVAVDNTNLAAWEIAPYYRLAEIMGCDVEIVRLEIDPSTAARRNIHAVPVERIFAMHQILRAEKLPAHWKERIVLPEDIR